MNNKTLCAFAAIGLFVSTGSSALAARVSYRELPDPVRKSVQKNKDDIKRIETFTHNGKTVYEVQLDKKGADRFIYFAPDGTKLNDQSLRNERLDLEGKLKFNNLPEPVQNTFKKETGSAKPSKVDLMTVNGKSIYAIEYHQSGMKNGQIWINEDGSLAQMNRSFGQRNNGQRNRQMSEGKTVAGFDRPLAATQKVDFENVPEAVKRTVRDVAGSNRIEDAERGTLDGRTVYEIAFKQNGKHNELRVDENGSIVQRVAADEVRFPGTLSINEVPAPVRQAIHDQVGSGEVNDIDKKTVEGKTVYEVGFKKQSGAAQHEIQIAEDGTVLGEPAGAEKK